MNDRAWVATRKGLFELRHSAGRWAIAKHSFIGEPVSMLLPPQASGRMLAVDPGRRYRAGYCPG